MNYRFHLCTILYICIFFFHRGGVNWWVAFDFPDCSGASRSASISLLPHSYTSLISNDAEDRKFSVSSSISSFWAYEAVLDIYEIWWFNAAICLWLSVSSFYNYIDSIWNFPFSAHSLLSYLLLPICYGWSFGLNRCLD